MITQSIASVIVRQYVSAATNGASSWIDKNHHDSKSAVVQRFVEARAVACAFATALQMEGHEGYEDFSRDNGFGVDWGVFFDIQAAVKAYKPGGPPPKIWYYPGWTKPVLIKHQGVAS